MGSRTSRRQWTLYMGLMTGALLGPWLLAQATQTPRMEPGGLEFTPETPWEYRSLPDHSGAKAISVLDADQQVFGPLENILLELDLDRATFLKPTEWKTDPENPHSVIRHNGLGTDQEWSFDAKAERNKPGTLAHRQRTEVLGRSLTVETRIGDRPHELIVTDDWGGLRREVVGSNGLHHVEDDFGPIAHIHRDEGGRLDEVVIAGRYRIEYTYPRPTPWPFWSSKSVVDLLTGEELAKVTAQTFQGVQDGSTTIQHLPRPQLWVRLENGPRQLEWDPLVYPEPMLLASRGTAPYALLSQRDPGRLVSRSLTLQDHKTTFGWERIDYTPTEVILHLQTDVPLGTQAQTTILELERPPEPTNGLLDPSVDPCGGDSGEEEGGGYTQPGQPLSPTQQQTVSQAKSRAGSQLDSVESCRGLFDGLPTALNPPSDFLTSSTYRYDPQSSPCQAGVAAWTTVGSYLVHLCDGFFTGSDVSSKAATLIHEGLHSAGLPENPPDPNAMTSSQIQNMVRTNCGL